MNDLEQQAKELVNKIYQPLGYLSCGVNSDMLWDYAKQRTIEFIKQVIQDLEKDYEERKDNITLNNYFVAKLRYYESLLKEIEKL